MNKKTESETEEGFKYFSAVTQFFRSSMKHKIHMHIRTYTIHRPDTVSVNLSLQPGNTQHMSQGPSVQLLFEQAGRPV